MPLTRLDHVNIQSADTAALARFYEKVLGLVSGPRPDFAVGGVWLYCGDIAAVHLVDAPRPKVVNEVRIEHFAFLAEGLAAFLAHLRGHGVPFDVSLVPGSNNRQINIFDPDGNHIEVQFAGTEEADLRPFDPAPARPA